MDLFIQKAFNPTQDRAKIKITDSHCQINYDLHIIYTLLYCVSAFTIADCQNLVHISV